MSNESEMAFKKSLEDRIDGMHPKDLRQVPDVTRGAKPTTECPRIPLRTYLITDQQYLREHDGLGDTPAGEHNLDPLTRAGNAFIRREFMKDTRNQAREEWDNKLDILWEAWLTQDESYQLTVDDLASTD